LKQDLVFFEGAQGAWLKAQGAGFKEAIKCNSKGDVL
jgi:hypothetical protein